MHKLLVLHCAETIKGGIATYLNDILELQAKSFGGDSVGVVIPESQLAQLTAPANVHIFTFRSTKNRLLNAARLAACVAKLNSKKNIAVYHLHSTFAGLFTRLAIKLFAPRGKIVYCAHGWAWDRYQSQFAKSMVIFAEKFLANVTDSIVCISKHELQTALTAGITPAKLYLVNNGLSVSTRAAIKPKHTWPDASFKLLFVGRYDRQKGVDLLLAALRLLGSGYFALLAGDTVIDDENITLNFPQNSLSLGWCNGSELEYLYNSADVLIVPSRWEGFGLVAIEAMRAGLPVIAMKVGGLVEIVLDGETGMLVEEQSPQALADSIRIFSEIKLDEIRKKSRQRFVEEYSIERVHKQLNEIYGF